MNESSRERRVLDLLEAVVELDTEGRCVYLDEHCNDPALRAEVERLLKAADRPATANFAPFGLEASARLDGTEAGPFTLLCEVGHGGMGTVYLARHNRLGRNVAVKFIRHGRFATEVERKRFATEQQSLSQLAHPSIVAIYDSGFLDDGQPYYAMEYVEGRPIDRFCRDERISVRERVALFVQVCHAVQHAHDRLIVHRDLKPANILVQSDATPKVLDFGIARWLDRSDSATTPSLAALTPEYAAPEQLDGGAITVAADVFGLGVVLYELLAGRRPFAGGASAADGQAARLNGPPPPSAALAPEADERTLASRRRELAGDLDTIVLKALQPDPGRRYRSAQALADDLDRYLGGLPVLARPDSATYRLAKFVRRHRVGLAGGAVAIALLLASGAMYAVDVTRARSEAERALDRAERVAAFTIDLFRPADPNVAQGDTLTVYEILARGSERLLPALQDEPEVLAEMLDVVGVIYGSLGRPAEARSRLEQAAQLRGQWVDTQPGDRRESLAHLAEVEIALNQLDSARAHLEAAERLIDPDAPEEGVEAGSILDLLGHVAFLQARYEEAAGYFERAIARYEVSPAGADSSERVRGLASALNNLGGLYFVRRELEASEHTLHRALTLYRSIHGESPHTDLIAIHNSLGNVYRLSDSLGGAIAQFEAALAMSRLLLGRHPTTATLASNLGVAFLDAGCAGNVRGLFEEALDIRRALLDPAHPSLGVGYYNLGVAVQKCEGRPAEAIPWLDRALASLTVGTQPNDLRLATNHYQLGEAHRMAGTPAMGLSHTREALRIRSLQLREPNRDIGRSLTSLGLLFTAVGRRDSAALYLDRAVAQFEAMPEPDAEGQRIALEASIDVLIAEGRCADARVRIDRRLALTDSVLPDRAALLRKRESCSTP